MTEVVYGGIEAGGTKFVCGVGSGPADLHLGSPIETTASPGQAIHRVAEFFRGQEVTALGIGCFGPLDLVTGRITSTPKAGWVGFDIVGAIRRELKLPTDFPVGFDTDVNAAALGEYRWGAAQGLNSFLYLTVGTGIGGGGMVNGQLIHGLIHPEMGHVRIPHDRDMDPFAGSCPYHHDCLEGLASGPALEERWGRPPGALPPDHPGWDLEAQYLGLAIANFVCTLSPQRVIIGGGVLKQAHLLPLVRQQVRGILNSYVQAPETLDDIDQYIVPPGLGEQAGVLGALALAEQTWQDMQRR